MKRFLIALGFFVCAAALVGCPGHGNVKKGHVPPGQYKKYK